MPQKVILSYSLENVKLFSPRGKLGFIMLKLINPETANITHTKNTMDKQEKLMFAIYMTVKITDITHTKNTTDKG